MTTAAAIALLAVGSYALRAGGLLLPAGDERLERLAEPATAALLASLVVTSTMTAGSSLSFDYRLVGLAAAAIAVATGRSLTVVLLAGVAATALARLLV